MNSAVCCNKIDQISAHTNRKSDSRYDDQSTTASTVHLSTRQIFIQIFIPKVGGVIFVWKYNFLHEDECQCYFRPKRALFNITQQQTQINETDSP